jgi:SAM-dependent methyltransferase
MDLTLTETLERRPALVESNSYWPDPDHPRYQRIANYLRRGVPVADSIFDLIYPSDVVKNSSTHWTPVKVAILASKLLCDGAERRVLDVGAGCGKFCLVGALSSPGYYVGVERRKNLSAVAAESGARLKVTSARFIQDEAFNLDWRTFDAFYFFNPFYELREPDLRMDTTLDGKGEVDFIDHVNETLKRLDRLRVHTRVVTYHGLGGSMPSSYELVKRLSAGSSFLNLWIKRI